MKMRPRSSLIFIFLFSSVISAMEDKEIIHPLEIPDTTTLVAYAIVNTHDINDILYPYEILKTLKAFSSTSPKIHATMDKLRYGIEKNGSISKQAETFNNYLINKIEKYFQVPWQPDSTLCLAAAYVATPYALSIVKKEYDSSKSDIQFQRKLGACYISPQNSEFFADQILASYADPTIEPLNETLKKFPPSTRDFCKKLIEEKPKE